MKIPVWTDHGTKLLGVLASLAGTIAMYLTPEQVVAILGAKGPGAVLIAGGILTYLRGRQNSSKSTPGLPPPDPNTIKSHWLATLVGLLVTAAIVVPLSGCATKPTTAQQVSFDSLTAAAVAITVQRDTSDPATWAKRAQLIMSIAKQVRPLATDEVVSVPAIAGAVAPLLDQAKLAPGERIAANTLVTALATIIDANTAPDSPAAASVVMVLDSAVRAASVYLPLERPTAKTVF